MSSRPCSRFRSLRTRVVWLLRRHTRGWPPPLVEFVAFGCKQAWASVFGGLLILAMLGTRLWYPEDAWLARYDFLVLTALSIQFSLLVLGLETWREAGVILLFHLLATGMELFKTHPAVGSWHYPEDSVLRLGTVPLFTGFLYSAVGSYLSRAWRILRLELVPAPSSLAALFLAAAIYLNFFTHHVTWDARWWLVAMTLVVYGRTIVRFRCYRVTLAMPLVVGVGLIACFVFVAENAGTLGRIWLYPNQHDAWRPVSLSKFGSWYLLLWVSFGLVMVLRRLSKSLSDAPAQAPFRHPRTGKEVVQKTTVAPPEADQQTHPGEDREDLGKVADDGGAEVAARGPPEHSDPEESLPRGGAAG